MFKYIWQRIAFAILALFIISILTFNLVALFAPDPLSKVAQREVEGATGHIKPTYDAVLLRLRIEHGIMYSKDHPVPIIVRYFRYIGNILTKGDFGFLYDPKNNPNSIIFTNMTKLFFNPLIYTLVVSMPAFVISAILGTVLGVVAGYKRGTWHDTSINIFVLIFIALPSFVIAPLVIAIATKLKISPIVPSFSEGKPIGEVIVAYLPPILVMTLGSLAVYTTYSRNQVITVLTSNYVLIAKTKGLSKKQIFTKYVLRNISIPLFAIVFPSFVFLLAGSIVVERYWSIPGTSQTITYAFPNGELFVVMFSTFFFSAISFGSEIIVDIMYAILDPRITYGAKSKKNYILFIKMLNHRNKLVRELKNANELEFDYLKDNLEYKLSELAANLKDQNPNEFEQGKQNLLQQYENDVKTLKEKIKIEKEQYFKEKEEKQNQLIRNSIFANANITVEKVNTND